MANVVEISELRRERRRRVERNINEQCVEVLEWNLRNSLDRYFEAPPEDRSFHATNIRRLSEVLEYTLRLL
jgi:hypothetical protein